MTLSKDRILRKMFTTLRRFVVMKKNKKKKAGRAEQSSASGKEREGEGEREIEKSENICLLFSSSHKKDRASQRNRSRRS